MATDNNYMTLPDFIGHQAENYGQSYMQGLTSAVGMGYAVSQSANTGINMYDTVAQGKQSEGMFFAQAQDALARLKAGDPTAAQDFEMAMQLFKMSTDSVSNGLRSWSDANDAAINKSS
jgi:hypothetical protein